VAVPPVDDSLLAHYGVHARFLVAVPLFIVAEGMAHAFTTRMLPYFVTSGLVPEAARPAFRQALADTARLRNATLPWIAILAIVIATLTAANVPTEVHQVNWAVEGEGSARHPGFGAWWLLYVGRGVFLTLLLGWVWRVVLFFVLFRKIARLDLSIVPTHPDRNGGLGFLARFPVVFVPVVFAIASVFASAWAHDVVYHQLSVRDLQWEMVAFVVVVLAVFLSPVVVFAKALSRAKKRALLEYGALVGRHGRLVRERWIEGRKLNDDAVLGAPELGPVADTVAMYEAVARMSPLLVSKQSVAPLLAAALVPMLALLSLQIPVVELVKRLVGALL
jgi:hypothetical protein